MKFAPSVIAFPTYTHHSQLEKERIERIVIVCSAWQGNDPVAKASYGELCSTGKAGLSIITLDLRVLLVPNCSNWFVSPARRVYKPRV